MEGERHRKQLTLWRLMAIIALLAVPMWVLVLAYRFRTAAVGRVDQFRMAVQTGQATDPESWFVAQIKEARERAATERNPTRAAAWARQAALDDGILQSLRRRKPSDTEQTVAAPAALTLAIMVGIGAGRLEKMGTRRRAKIQASITVNAASPEPNA